jgi:hypothetical protein
MVLHLEHKNPNMLHNTDYSSLLNVFETRDLGTDVDNNLKFKPTSKLSDFALLRISLF